MKQDLFKNGFDTWETYENNGRIYMRATQPARRENHEKMTEAGYVKEVYPMANGEQGFRWVKK